jgi:hypothetical protein
MDPGIQQEKAGQSAGFLIMLHLRIMLYPMD